MNSQICLLLAAFLPLGACWVAPSFCNGYECPVFTLVNTYPTFEERFYNASQWITTSIQDATENYIRDGFWKLYYFMQGENNDELEIALTKPVVVSVSEGDGNRGREVSISFFISSDIIIPQPNDGTITIKNLPAATVYVRVFGGIDIQGAFDNVDILKNDLVAAGKMFNGATFDAAVYDPPLVLFNRHNEVWLYAN